jgi:flagellar motor switch protein FliN/FliY
MAQTTEATEQKQQQKDPADSKKQAQSVELSEVNGAEASGAAGSLDILLDMQVPVTVAVGKREIPVRQLLQLGPGSVLKLDKAVDAPVDLYLKDAKFATGTVVVVDDRFAVRIEEIIGPGSHNIGNPLGYD